MTREEAIKIVAEKTKGIRSAMLVTVDYNGILHGRPMATQDIELDGSVWFMTSKDSEKISHIQQNPHVGLMYGDGGGVKFVSLSGVAEIHTDKEKIREYWNDFYKAWFENENDPAIRLIKVVVKGGEFWDHAGGKLGAYADMLKTAVTGNKDAGDDKDENQKFTIDS